MSEARQSSTWEYIMLIGFRSAAGTAFLLGLILTTYSGCATQPPKYVQNWNQVQVGMTKDQVTKLLGQSPAKIGPVDFKVDTGNDLLGALLLGSIFDLQYERWDYGEAGLEGILEPSPKAYVLYFDRDGKVVRLRGPVPGTQPSPSNGPYEYDDVSDTLRSGGDYLESIAQRPEGPRSDRLKPPVPVNPPDRAVFSHFPREIVLKWRPQPGSPANVEYLVQDDFTANGKEEDFGDWSQESEPFFTNRTAKTSMNIRFVGAQPGRWRVKTIDKTGESEWSPWQYFRFTR